MRRILLDHNVPAALGRLLTGHDSAHTLDMGWERLTNGDLIAAAQRHGFEILVTADQNIPHQHNAAERKIALVVLRTNHWITIRDNHEAVLRAVENVRPGGLAIVTFDRRRRPQRNRR